MKPNLLTLRNLKPHPEIIILGSFELGGKVPTEMQLLPIGKWDGYRRGSVNGFEITPGLVEASVQHFKERKSRAPQRDLVIDYEHQTLTGEIAPAAGWIRALENRRSEGLWATDVKFTAKAEEYIKNGEYRYQSAVAFFNYLDKDTAKIVPLCLHSCALTNDPFIDQMIPVAAKDSSHHLYIFNSSTFQQEVQMDQLIAKLAALFSLAATATQEELVAKVNWLTEQLTAAGVVAKEGTVLTAQGIIDQIKTAVADAKAFKAQYALVAKALGAMETDPVEKLTALIATAKDKTGFVARTEFDALQASINEKEIDQRIAFFMSREGQGKISPATRDSFRAFALKDRKGFEELLAKAAPWSGVPLQDIKQAAGIIAKGAAVDELTASIGKTLGVKPEDLKKTVESLAATN